MRLNDQGIRARVWLKLGGAWRLEALGWGLKRCFCEVCGGATAENEDTQGKPKFSYTSTHFQNSQVTMFAAGQLKSWCNYRRCHLTYVLHIVSYFQTFSFCIFLYF
jgi:hypothetical protein